MNFNELDISVLKVILSSKRHAVDFIGESDDKIFSTNLFRFAKVIISYVKLYKDVPTRRVLLEQNAKDEKLCAYVNTVWDKVDSVEADDREFKHNVNKLKDRYAEKLLATLREEVDADITIEKQVAVAQETLLRVKGLYSVKAFDAKTIKESLKDFSAAYKAKKFDPSIGRGIYTGYSSLDFVTNGLRPQELFLIGGESGSGKSMMLHNMGVQMWLQQNTIDQETDFTKGYNIIYFSLEMPYEQCMNRVLSRMADVPYKGIRDGNLTDEEEARLLKAMHFIHKYPYEFKIVDLPRGATAEQMELIFNETKLLFDPHVVIVDYLSLMELDGSGGEDSDWLKLGVIAGKLHEFGRVNDCLVISAVQLNRHTGKGKDAGDAIGAHRIGRSALILTHANHFIQLEKRPQEQQFSDMICHMIKSRDNEGLKFKLQKRFANSALLDMPNDSSEDGFIDSDDISNKIAELNKASEKV